MSETIPWTLLDARRQLVARYEFHMAAVKRGSDELLVRLHLEAAQRDYDLASAMADQVERLGFGALLEGAR